MTVVDRAKSKVKKAPKDDPAQESVKLWYWIMAIHKIVSGEVRKRFRDDFATSLARFDLMAQLSRTPKGIRMGSLSDRLMVTSGNVTQLVDQLEEDDLVERSQDPTNRRAWLVRLSPKGKLAFRSMAGAHQEWMHELFSGLDPQEKKLLMTVLPKEYKHLRRTLHHAKQNEDFELPMLAQAGKQS